MKNCVFCKVIAKELESSIVYEDKDILVFMDLHPVNEGHLMIIPKEHVPDFFDVDDKTLSKIMIMAKKLAGIIDRMYKPKKVGLVIAGFDVPHTHIHVHPMHDYNDITSKKALENKLGKPSREELNKIANKISKELK